jgi:hypothetical protein
VTDRRSQLETVDNRRLDLKCLNGPPEKYSATRSTIKETTMSQTDWAKIYAAMDKRIVVKYQQLPKGEQIGKRPPPGNQQGKNS